MSSTPDPQRRQRFLDAMSHAAATVNVVTTDGAAGKGGVTVSAMAAVSADTERPTLLVCIHHQSRAADLILKNGVFVVNVLKDDQSYISDSFAGRFEAQLQDRFDCAEWTGMPSGAPRVVDPLAAFDCRVASGERVGTHHVFMGEVENIFIAEMGSPLIYAQRAYGAASRIEASSSPRQGRGRAERRLGLGCLHTFGPFLLPELIQRMQASHGDIALDLIEGDQRRVQEALRSGQTELALIYDRELSGDLALDRLTELQPYVLLPEGHPLAERGELLPRDLVGEPMVLLDAPPSPAYFQGVMREAGIEPVVAFRSRSFEMVRGMVGHGLGYALLATRPASPMTYDGRALAARPLVSEAEPSRVVLARRKGRRLTETAEAFRALCLDAFGHHP